MSDWSPLEDDVLLKGLLTVVVRWESGGPCAGRQVVIRGCGFV